MTVPTPIIYVSHLPSASSFYASLTQPLNIRYLSATTTFPATLHFGLITDIGKETLFALTQSPIPNPRPTNIYLPAPSPKSIHDFFNKSRLLNPGCRDTNIGDTEEGANTRVITRDLDGNMLEAVYSSRGGHGQQRSVQTSETASTEKEARRVLEWQKDVAKSVSAADDAKSQVSSATEMIYRSQVGPSARRADSYPMPMRLIRRETVTEHYQPHQDDTVTATGGGGISGKAIIGTLLGAAAGAAVAYAMVRSESPPQKQRPSIDGGGGRTRRASFAAPTGYARSHPPAVEMIPARSYVSGREEEARPRYMQYTVAQPPPMVRAHTLHDMGRMIDERSHVSAGQRSSGSRRSASEHRGGERFERSLTILPRSGSPGTHVSHRSQRSHGEKSHHTSRSHVSGSHHSDAKKSRHSHHSHHSSGSSKHDKPRSHVSERDSYASARSHTSESTMKAGRGSTTTTIKIMGNGQIVRDDERKSYVSARDIPLPRSIVSVARDVPLPHSVVGGPGYAASVAPSDSISSVGVKRERDRLRDRMRERW